MTKLFIVGFPKDMSQISLLELISNYGAVNSVTIVTDQDTGVSKGYGFVNMDDDAGAIRAIENLNGKSIGERTISVRLAAMKNMDDSAGGNNPTAAPDETRFLSKNNTSEKPKRPRRQR